MARADEKEQAGQQDAEQNRAHGERAAQAERADHDVRQPDRIVVRLDDARR